MPSQRAAVKATHYAVSSGHPLATRAGVEILRSGVGAIQVDAVKGVLFAGADPRRAGHTEGRRIPTMSNITDHRILS